MKQLVIFILIIFMFACKQEFAENKPNIDTVDGKINIDTVTYKDKIKRDTLLMYDCTGNDQADIKLTVWSDNSFDFYLKTISIMPTDNVTTVNSTGAWTMTGDMLRLTFLKNRPLIRVVFDENYSVEKEFTVINDSVVDINSKLDEICIWGISCNKIKKTPQIKQ